MWVGKLRLEFERSGKKTVLARRRHQGPLLVQRAFREPDGGCQVYLLHPPGGVVGGDQLSLSFEVGFGARALVTTPAATKIYKSPGRPSKQDQCFQVRAGAVFEWLPQETIVYAGAQSRAETRIELEPGSHYLGWDITCLGHDERGLTHGCLVQHWWLAREGKLLWSERAAFEGGSAILGARWGLAGRPVVGTLVGTGARAEHVELVRARLPESDTDWFSVTGLGEVLVCRYLGYSAEAAKSFFCMAWAILREGVSGRRAHHPRVWAT
jgi:urease accessory protein